MQAIVTASCCSTVKHVTNCKLLALAKQFLSVVVIVVGVVVVIVVIVLVVVGVVVVVVVVALVDDTVVINGCWLLLLLSSMQSLSLLSHGAASPGADRHQGCSERTSRRTCHLPNHEQNAKPNASASLTLPCQQWGRCPLSMRYSFIGS